MRKFASGRLRSLLIRSFQQKHILRPHHPSSSLSSSLPRFLSSSTPVLDFPPSSTSSMADPSASKLPVTLQNINPKVCAFSWVGFFLFCLSLLFFCLFLFIIAVFLLILVYFCAHLIICSLFDCLCRWSKVFDLMFLHLGCFDLFVVLSLGIYAKQFLSLALVFMFSQNQKKDWWVVWRGWFLFIFLFLFQPTQVARNCYITDSLFLTRVLFLDKFIWLITHIWVILIGLLWFLFIYRICKLIGSFL